MSLNENSYTSFPNISCNSDEAISNAVSHIFNQNTFINVDNIVSNIETTDRNRYFNNNINNTPLNDINNQNIEILIDNTKERRKYDFDSARKKLKHLVLKYALGLVNQKMACKIQKIEYEQIKNIRIEFEKVFMYKTLGEIFSSSISKRYFKTKDRKNYNKNIVNELRLLNQNLKDIFVITFLDCLNHFIDKKKNEKLDKMVLLENIDNLDEDDKKSLKKWGLVYEEEILKRRPRVTKNDKKVKK
jgi:hypothetical protein